MPSLSRDALRLFREICTKRCVSWVVSSLYKLLRCSGNRKAHDFVLLFMENAVYSARECVEMILKLSAGCGIGGPYSIPVVDDSKDQQGCEADEQVREKGVRSNVHGSK